MSKTIAMNAVTSSQIAAVGYDPATKTMAIEFHPSKSRGETSSDPSRKAVGPTYHYFGVEQEDHDRLVGAESIGKHFNQHVKVGYPYERLERDTEAQEAQAASEDL